MAGEGWTLVFFNREAGRVWLRFYSGEGRLESEEELEARQVVVRGEALASGGLGSGLTVLSIPGRPQWRLRGSVLVLEGGGGAGAED